MRVRRQDGLELGWFATQLQPGELSAVFVVKATFALTGDGLHLVEAEGMPVCGDLEDADGTGGLAYANDFVPYKPKADVLLRAHAHAPNGEPVRYTHASFRVGQLQKTLLAIGDRKWQRGILGSSPGEPATFTAMPLTWGRAFGGADDPHNPAGVGRKGDPMPNVEWPERMLRSPRDGTEAAGFGPIATEWQPRKGKMGTYRGSYLKERWPWYPADMEWGHFSSAPTDQQVEGYLRGDEEIAFQNLHAANRDILTKLPGLQARCFATFSGEELRQVPLKLDTLFADLDNDRIVLVWRGRTPAPSLRLKELQDVFAMLEPLDEERSMTEYRELSRQATPEEIEAAEADEAFRASAAALAATVAETEAEVAAVEAKLDALAAQAKSEAAAQQAWLQQQPSGDANESESAGAPNRTQQTAEAGPPQTVAPAAPEAGDGESEEDEEDAGEGWTRERVVAAVAAGHTLEDADLRGLDLHAVDFSGAVLTGAVLDEANLRGANFTGANLDGAELTGSKIGDANFQGASLEQAVFDDLDLCDANFAETQGSETSFAGCQLSGCNFDEATLDKVDFTGATLAKATFRRAELASARFAEATAAGIDCTEATMIGLHGGDECNFQGAVFRRSDLTGSNFTGALLDTADFAYAKAPNALFTEARLQGADLSRANLTRSVFDDADLSGAQLLQTNMLYCSLERVDFAEADARLANLYSAGLWQAKTERANFDGANLAGTLLEEKR